jgi:hypothetical protein
VSRAFSAAVLAVVLAHWVVVAFVPVNFSIVPLQCALGVVALVLLAATEPQPELVRPPTFRACGVRSIAGVVFLGCGTAAVFLLRDLHGQLNGVISAALLGLALGPLAVFELGSATTRRGALLASALAGWGTVVALAAATLEVAYLDPILEGRGAPAALGALERCAGQLIADPPRTLHFFAWPPLLVTVAVWAHLRGWPLARQVAFAVAVAGASWNAFTSPYEDSFARLAVLPLALPLVFAAADRLARRPRDDGDGEDPLNPRAFRIAVLLAVLVALIPAGREGYRWHCRRQVATRVAVDLSAAHAELLRAENRRTHELTMALQGASSPNPATPELEVVLRSVESRRDEISSDIARLTALLVEIVKVQSEGWKNGGGVSDGDRRELSSVRDELRLVLDDLRILEAAVRPR